MRMIGVGLIAGAVAVTASACGGSSSGVTAAPKAAEGGFSTIVFTFTATKAGAYVWRCFTPCGGDPKGMGGSMATKGWMQGHVTVA